MAASVYGYQKSQIAGQKMQLRFLNRGKETWKLLNTAKANLLLWYFCRIKTTKQSDTYPVSGNSDQPISGKISIRCTPSIYSTTEQKLKKHFETLFHLHVCTVSGINCTILHCTVCCTVPCRRVVRSRLSFCEMMPFSSFMQTVSSTLQASLAKSRSRTCHMSPSFTLQS